MTTPNAHSEDESIVEQSQTPHWRIEDLVFSTIDVAAVRSDENLFISLHVLHLLKAAQTCIPKI